MSRLTLTLDEGWLFTLDPHKIGLQQEWSHGIPDGKTVTVPHTWNVEEGNESYKGNGWYQYNLKAEIEWDNRCIRLMFHGVYRTARLWINGHEVECKQPSSYLPFVVEITSHINLGSPNSLVMLVNNDYSIDGLPYSNSFDWADDGGIFRDVQLIVSSKPTIRDIAIQAEPKHDANSQHYSGSVKSDIYLLETDLEYVNVHVTIQSYKTQQNVYNKEFLQLPISRNTISLPEININEIKLWHFDAPELYEITYSLEVNRQILDHTTVRTGFRTISVKGNQLWLNNEPVRLMGIEWMPGSNPNYGMAETEENMIKMLNLMKEANCVITRFHWQQSEKLLNWCDENGLLVQEEIPYWQQPFDVIEPYYSIAEMQIESMIKWHKHHPSIFSWGVGNELDGQSLHTQRYVEKMREGIAQLDPHRLCSYVSNTFHYNPAEDATRHGDLLMWNDYIGTWHSNRTREEVIAQANSLYPSKPLIVAEYGLCEPVFSGGDARRIEILLNQTDYYSQHPHIAAAIFFSLNDYRTQMGEDGVGKLKQRVHGVTDLYGNVKESYWHLKETSAPVTIELTSSESNTVQIEIMCKNTLPQYTISNYQLEYHIIKTDDIIMSNVFSLPQIAPGEKTFFALENINEQVMEIELHIRRGTGFSVISKRYTLR